MRRKAQISGEKQRHAGTGAEVAQEQSSTSGRFCPGQQNIFSTEYESVLKTHASVLYGLWDFNGFVGHERGQVHITDTHPCESSNKVMNVNVWLLCIHVGSDL